MLKSVIGQASVRSRTTMYPIERLLASADGYLELSFNDGSILKAQYNAEKHHWVILIDRDDREVDAKSYLANALNEKFASLSDGATIELIRILEGQNRDKPKTNS